MGQISLSPSSSTAIPAPKNGCRSYVPGQVLPVVVGMNAHCLAWAPAWNEEVQVNRICLLTPSAEAYYFNHDVECLRWFEQLAAEAEGSADVGEDTGFSGALPFFVYLGALTPVCTSPCPL